MALRQSFIALRIKNLTKEREEKQPKLDEINKELEAIEADVRAEVEEPTLTEEDIAQMEARVEELEKEKSELEEAIRKIDEQIKEQQDEIEEINEKHEDSERSEPEKTIENREVIPMNKRQERLAYLDKENVREFYGTLRDIITGTRAVTNADYTIPEEVILSMLPMVAERSTFYNEVTVVRLNGKGRAIIEGTSPEAVWTEMTASVNELTLAFSKVELDGYKVGGFVPIGNSILEDSLLNLADYVEDKLATAIAKALDKAIVAGTGSTGRQPTGITNGKQAVALANTNIETILKTMGDLRADNLGTVKLAMRRSDYFNYIFGQLIPDQGFVALPDVRQPNLGGIPVIFTDYVKAGTFIIGDFKKYLLGERADNTFAVSSDVKFIEDQTVFKMTARYDGKVADANYFGYYGFGFTPAGEITVTLAAGSASGTTKAAITEDLGSGNSYVIKKNATVPAKDTVLTSGTGGWTAYTEGADIHAVAGETLCVVEITSAGKTVNGAVAEIKAANIKA